MKDSQTKTTTVTGMVSPFVAPWRVAENEARIGFLIRQGEPIPRVDAVKDWAMGSGESAVTREVPVEDAVAKEDFLIVMDRLLAQGPSCVKAVIPANAILDETEPSPFKRLSIPKTILTEVEAKRWANTIQCINNFGVWTENKIDDQNAKGFHDSLRSIVFTARLVFEGDTYGPGEIVHDGEPMIEFFDQRYKHTDYGQFVSRYYTETLFGSNNPTYMRRHEGLCLDGSVNCWNLSERTMLAVSKWSAERFEDRLTDTSRFAMKG